MHSIVIVVSMVQYGFLAEGPKVQVEDDPNEPLTGSDN